MPKINWVRLTPIIISVLSLIVSGLALSTSREATGISREAYKRASGQTIPLFTINCDTSHVLIVGDRVVDPETILIEIKNDGSEPLESIRYDVLMDIIWAGDRAKNQPIKPTRFTHEFGKILRPGKTTSIDITSDIVAHLKTLKIPPGTESFWTRCSIVFSAKVVGSTYFAAAQDDDFSNHTTNCSFGVTWDSKPNVKRKPLNFGVDLSPPK